MTADTGRRLSSIDLLDADEYERHDAIDHWALCALSTSAGARTFYDNHRAAGDTHHQALRALGNRLVGILHGCLRHHAPYNEHTAWAHRMPAAA